MQSSKQEMFSRSRNNVNNIVRIKREFYLLTARIPVSPDTHTVCP
jgi:hypothetical protein